MPVLPGPNYHGPRRTDDGTGLEYLWAGTSRFLLDTNGVTVPVGQTLTIAGSLAVSGSSVITGALNLVEPVATALTVAAAGANYIFQVDAATTSAATGLKITGAAAGSRVALAAISSGTDEGISIDAKGSGTIRFNQTGTGAIVFDRSATLSGGATISSTVTDSATTTKTGTFDASGATVTLPTRSAFLDLEERLKGADGADLALSETADDFFRDIGTNQWLIQGEATVNETELSAGLFSFVLPENYVSGGTITLIASALVTLAGDAANDAASTIDMECRKVTKTTGAVGSDLVTTAATTLATAGADYSFTVTPTSLVAGDKLVCKLATSVVETAGGTGAANSTITRLGATIQVNK